MVNPSTQTYLVSSLYQQKFRIHEYRFTHGFLDYTCLDRLTARSSFLLQVWRNMQERSARVVIFQIAFVDDLIRVILVL